MLGLVYQSLMEVEQTVTPQVKLLLQKLVGEMSRDEIQAACELKDRKSFVARYLKPALDVEVIEMTIPEKPRSRLQPYRLTMLGKQAKEVTSHV